MGNATIFLVHAAKVKSHDSRKNFTGTLHKRMLTWGLRRRPNVIVTDIDRYNLLGLLSPNLAYSSKVLPYNVVLYSTVVLLLPVKLLTVCKVTLWASRNGLNATVKPMLSFVYPFSSLLSPSITSYTTHIRRGETGHLRILELVEYDLRYIPNIVNELVTVEGNGPRINGVFTRPHTVVH